jgi:GH18 family chitinase
MRWWLRLALVALVWGGVAGTPGALWALARGAPSAGFKVVGYLPYWRGSVDAVRMDRLTHVIYAFAFPRASGDGTLLPLADAARLSRLVSAAHASDVKVLISIAGNGGDGGFEALAASPASVQTFVDGVLALCDQYQLDGVDIDWEYPDPGASSANYAALLHALSGPLHAQGRLLTAAVMPRGYYADAVPATVFADVDFLNLMVYNNTWTNHSDHAFAVQALEYWQGRGLAAEKTVLGVPFYSYAAAGTTVAYAELAANDPLAACRDTTSYNGTQVVYNGFPTLRAKTSLALERAGGVMVWHLGHDTSGPTSLLGAIHGQISGDWSEVMPCFYAYAPLVAR